MPEVTDPALLRQLNGASEPAAPMPRGGVIIPKAPPAPPSGYRQTGGGLQAIPGGPADPQRPQPVNVPTGWKIGPDGKTAERIPGLPADGPNEDQRKAKMQGATLDSIVGQINRVQELYDSGIRDESLWNAFGALDAVGPSAGRFNSAGQGLADQGLAAFRVPGVGAQSDLEAKQFATANTPQAGDWDQSIEEKLANVRRRVDANRAAIGLPPAQWAGVKREDPQAGAATSPNGAASPPSSGAPPVPGAPMPMTLSPSGDSMVAAGETRQVPVDSPAAKQVDAMIRQGIPFGQIAAFVQQNGLQPISPAQYAEWRTFLQRHPDYRGGITRAYEERPVSTIDQLITAAGNNPAGAFVANAGQFLSGDTLGNLSSDPEGAHQTLDILSQQNPTSAALGDVAGGMLASAAVEGLLARAGMVPGLVRGALADTAVGAANGAGAADDGNRLEGAALGAGTALTGNLVGHGLGRGGRAFAEGVSDPGVRALQAEGIPLTAGQTYGQSGRAGATLKAVEDKATSAPVIGDMIAARRTEGLERLNTKAFDHALKPIGASVRGEVGEAAMLTADRAVSDAYDRALKGVVAPVDQKFGGDLTRAVVGAMRLPRIGEELADNVKTIIEPYMTGNSLTGDAMQQISRELRALKSAYGRDPLASRIAQSIDATEDAVFGLFERNRPEVLPAYNAAKQAARRLYTLERAVLAGKNKGGRFTPAQLGQADRAGTIAYGGKRQASTGQGEFHDLQRAAQDVLPSDYPDSGTAGRLAQIAIPGAIAGTGAGIGYAAGDPQEGAATGLTLAALLAAAYSKAGQRLLTKPGRGMKEGTLRRKALESPKTTRALSSTGGAIGGALAAQ